MSGYIHKSEHINAYTKLYEINGQLTMSEDAYEYIVKDWEQDINLSEVLKEIFLMNNSVAQITIVVDGKLAFKEDGYFTYKRDEYNVWSYFVDGENLDEFLFNHTGLRMSICIKAIENAEAKK